MYDTFSALIQADVRAKRAAKDLVIKNNTKEKTDETDIRAFDALYLGYSQVWGQPAIDSATGRDLVKQVDRFGLFIWIAFFCRVLSILIIRFRR